MLSDDDVTLEKSECRLFFDFRNIPTPDLPTREGGTMCTAFFLFGVHPRLKFLMVFNRDEFLDR